MYPYLAIQTRHFLKAPDGALNPPKKCEPRLSPDANDTLPRIEKDTPTILNYSYNTSSSTKIIVSGPYFETTDDLAIVSN